MGTPATTVTKQDGNTGVVQPSQSNVLAIIAPSAMGVANVAASYTRQADILTDRGLGPLIEDAAYYLQTARKPVLLITPTTTTAGAIAAVNSSLKVGTSVVTATGTPLDEYNIIFKVIAGGTIGVTGITFQFSLDGGSTYSGTIALGTAVLYLFNVPRPTLAGSSGVTFNFAAGTLLAGDIVTTTTTHAQMTNSDLLTALEALRITKLPWDNVLIDAIATATLIATVDSWLSALEGVGVYKMAWMNIRHKNIPVPSTESEAAYATAAATVVSATATLRVDVGADGGNLPSPVTGLVLFRPTSLAIATRANAGPIGVDPAFKQLGAIPGFQLSDANGNPLWHDEQIYPGLDALRLSTLRTFPGDIGTFINNANMLSGVNSDYVFDQHARCANVCATVATQGLNKSLSKGVRKQPQDPVTGKLYILEQDASAIEEDTNPQIDLATQGQVNGARVQLSRVDDLSSNAGAMLNADIQIQALAYIKGFNVVEKFVKAIQVTSTP